MDDRGARRDRRRTTPATSASGSSSTCCGTAQARRGPLPRRLCRRRRQRRAVHAGRLRALRRGAVLFRDAADRRCPTRGPTRTAATAGIRPRVAARRARARRLYRAATPQPVQRLEGIRLPDWERQGSDWRVPRCSPDADPAVRRRRGVRAGDARRRQATARELDGVRPGRRRRRRTSRTTCKVRRTAGRRRRADRCAYGLGVIARPRGAPADRHDHGVHRRGANLRVADRSAARGAGLRDDRDGLAADEGDPGPRRRAGLVPAGGPS